jgi:eukaryotic-like serine/threonine-protein kinase
VLSGFAAFQYVRIKRGKVGSSSWSVHSVGICAALVAVAMAAHVGVASFAPIVLPIIVYYYGLTDFRRLALVVYAVIAIGYLVATALSISGLLPMDQTLVPVANASSLEVAFMALYVEVVLAGTFWLGRRSRRGTLAAMHELESARREIHRRGALLAEAQAELDQVLDAGRIGRFTGARIGPYHAGEVLGRGGMGEVYRAAHEETAEPAAVKVLHPNLQDDPDQLARFFREAEITSALRSPYIAEVYATGRAIDGSPFIAMELLAGQDLASALRRQGRLGERDILKLAREVASALGAAQAAGIVHRDVKPQNLFLARSRGDACWKVLDFGISKMTSSASTLTHGALVGTPGYMSPEQARGLEVDPTSDIFSLGAIVYRVLTGRPAFSAPDPLVTLDRVARSMPARPTDLVRAPGDIDLALALALAKDPAERYPTAPQLARALEAAFRGALDEELRERARRVLAKHAWEDAAGAEAAGTSLPAP